MEITDKIQKTKDLMKTIRHLERAEEYIKKLENNNQKITVVDIMSYGDHIAYLKTDNDEWITQEMLRNIIESVYEILCNKRDWLKQEVASAQVEERCPYVRVQ